MSTSEISDRITKSDISAKRDVLFRFLHFEPATSHAEWIFPVVCCLVLLGQLILSTRQLSATADEPTHLYAGYRVLKCGDFGYSPEHTPLAKVVAALPLLFMSAPVDCSTPKRSDIWASLDWLYGAQRERLPEAMLNRARIAASFFTVGLCILVWIIARRMFGFATAAIAATLFVFEPNVLAHGALVTTDMALATTLVFTVLAFYLWVTKRSPGYLALTGVAAGMALVAKMSGLAVLPILCLLAVTEASLQYRGWRLYWRHVVRNLAAVALISLIAVGTLWAMYDFRFSARRDGSGTPIFDSRTTGTDGPRDAASTVLSLVRTYKLLPEAYVEGLSRIRGVAGPSRPMFILGRTHSRGRWYFFPASMIVKSTVAFLALLVVLTAAAARKLFRRHRREVLFIVLPAAVFLQITISANQMNSNVRHVLPVTAFLLILAAAGSVEMARRAKWARNVLAGALVLHAASSLYAFPNYLSYANELAGGPSNAYRMVPYNDWGQSFIELKSYLERHPSQPCYLATIYMTAEAYDLPCQPFWGGGPFQPVPPHVHGTVVLSSLFVENMQHEFLRPITKHKPIARIGGSALLVYEGDFDLRKAAGATESYAAWWAMNEGRFETALRHARRGVEITPENFYVRLQYCRALVANDMFDLAKTECHVTRALLFEFTKPDRQTADGLTQAIMARRAMDAGRLQSALEHARAAIELAPKSGTAHFEYCRALMAARERDAERECENARVFGRNSANPPPNTTSTSIDLMLSALGERPR